MRLVDEIRGGLTALAVVAFAALIGATFHVPLPGAALLQSLQFHVALPVLGLAVLMFLMRARWRAVLVALAASASLAEGAWDVGRQQWNRIEASAGETIGSFKVLSFNLLFSNLGNGERIADMILASGADVVMTMESGPLFAQLDRLAAEYPFRVGCDRTEDDCDLMLMSRLPLDRTEVRGLSWMSRERLMLGTVTIAGQPVHVAAVHMTKPYFDDFAVVDSRILRRRLDERTGPIVIAGDFNAAPWSEEIVWLTNTTGLLPGPGYPATWPVALGPAGVPIDNVFARPPLVIESVEALPDPMGSNHRGLVATLALKAPVPD